MMEIIWVILIVIVAAICAALLGKQTDRQEENIMEEKAIRFAEECYIEGIIPIQKVKRLAEFYLVEESERTIEWQEARKRIEDTLNSYTKKEEKGSKLMIECVMLDTLPEKANLILNILWDRNHPMSVTELIEALKEEFSLNCEKEEVQDYLRFLLASDYAEKKRKGLKVLYAALGSEYTL